MRFLKAKIALAAQAKDQQFPVEQESHSADASLDSSIQVKLESNKDRPSSLQPLTPKKNDRIAAKSTKTVVKNYGKAIASFALNKIAEPYLNRLSSQENIKLKDFLAFVSRAKETIEGIDTFRALLLVTSSDSQKTASMKKIFQGIAEVFIKYFSVNWIFSGRMVNKDVHLNFRFKMLRRIKNPELFTYLK